MRILLSALVASALVAGDPHGAPHAAAPAAAAPALTADAALQRLIDGNERFATGTSKHPSLNQERRCETFAQGQHPYVTILSCADSRVPPEMIFDAGIGDLFVIRVAGNVSDVDEIASIEYGAAHLNTPLIVVMGHAKCGAVTAVCEGGELHGNLAKLLDNVQPAVAQTRQANPDLSGAPLITKAIRANVEQSMADLITNSESVRDLVKNQKAVVVGAIYDLHSGKVEFTGRHPHEADLLKAAPTSHEAPASHGAPATHHAPATTHEAPAHPDDHAPATHGAHGDAGHEAGDPDHPATETSMVKEYGTIAAFVAGTVTVSTATVAFVRRYTSAS